MTRAQQSEAPQDYDCGGHETFCYQIEQRENTDAEYACQQYLPHCLRGRPEGNSKHFSHEAPCLSFNVICALDPALCKRHVKVVQRLPVRIELTDYDPQKMPLFFGLSATPYVYCKEPPTGPHAGEILQPMQPLPQVSASEGP